MSFPHRQTIKSYLTENKICKLSIVTYFDGIIEVTGQIEDIFATGNVEYWTSMENPIKPLSLPVINTFPDMPDPDHIPIPDSEPYFNINMNKGSTNILNGQFKFSVKYTLMGEHFKLPSDPVYIHLVVKIADKEPININVKMDMTTSMRFIDEKQPSFNPFGIGPDNKGNKKEKQPTFYDGYGDHEHQERRKAFSDQNKPAYGDRALNLIDLPTTNQEYFGMPEKKATSTLNQYKPDVDFRRIKNTDLTPFDPFGR